MSAPLPLLIEPTALEGELQRTELRVIDLSRADIHQRLHIPGAQLLDYGAIVTARPPVGGLLPEPHQLEQALGAIGLTPEHAIVAYDDEGGGKAARLLWTLEAIGHRGGLSLLNGGLHAWANEGHPVTRDTTVAARADYPVTLPEPSPPVASAHYILDRLGDPQLALLDARSHDEYTGERLYSARGGHIPGAVNFEWTAAMDQANNLRLRPAEELLGALAALGVTTDKEVITYCQTHHRSAYSYWMLRVLGFPRVKGYPGSWSEWGNRRELPLER